MRLTTENVQYNKLELIEYLQIKKFKLLNVSQTIPSLVKIELESLAWHFKNE
jgi:hypothetical protein